MTMIDASALKGLLDQATNVGSMVLSLPPVKAQFDNLVNLLNDQGLGLVGNALQGWVQSPSSNLVEQVMQQVDATQALDNPMVQQALQQVMQQAGGLLAQAGGAGELVASVAEGGAGGLLGNLASMAGGLFGGKS
jgi:predicted PurR-regulated permease PerM